MLSDAATWIDPTASYCVFRPVRVVWRKGSLSSSTVSSCNVVHSDTLSNASYCRSRLVPWPDVKRAFDAHASPASAAGFPCTGFWGNVTATRSGLDSNVGREYSLCVAYPRQSNSSGLLLLDKLGVYLHKERVAANGVAHFRFDGKETQMCSNNMQLQASDRKQPCSSSIMIRVSSTQRVYVF